MENTLLSLSNAVFFVPVFIHMTRGGPWDWVCAYWLAATGLASAYYHWHETKHGIGTHWHLVQGHAAFESYLLNLDRFCAVAAGVCCLYRSGWPWAWPWSWWAMGLGLLALSGASELMGRLGWTHTFVALHLMWHVGVFGFAAVLALRP